MTTRGCKPNFSLDEDLEILLPHSPSPMMASFLGDCNEGLS